MFLSLVRLALCSLSRVFFSHVTGLFAFRPLPIGRWSPKCVAGHVQLLCPGAPSIATSLFLPPHSFRNGYPWTQGALSPLCNPGKLSFRKEMQIFSRSQHDVWIKNPTTSTSTELTILIYPSHAENSAGKEW